LEEEVIHTTLNVMDQLSDYASPKARLTRLLKSGKLIQVRRGLYVDDPNTLKQALAACLYGPSYISFQYALAQYGLIPERVTVMTSASFNKNRDKLYRTPLGEFRYWYLPPAIYPYGLRLEEEQGLSYLIATPEKALCDAVYKLPAVTGTQDMEALLLEDWRMERETLLSLNRDFISWIAPLYKRKSLLALARWFKKEGKR
jgi:predicted transcriptional regulator of viral defense system